MDESAVGALDALPAIVAIHGVVAAGHGGDLAAELAELLFEPRDVVDAAVGRRVAAVHETVDENFFNFGFAREFEKREEVVDVRVHAAVADEAHEVELVAASAFDGG